MVEKELFYPEEDPSLIAGKEAKEQVLERGTLETMKSFATAIRRLEHLIRRDQLGALTEDVYSRVLISQENTKARRSLLSDKVEQIVLGSIYTPEQIRIQEAGFIATAGVRMAFDEIGVKSFYPKLNLDFEEFDVDVFNADTQDKNDMWVNIAYLEYQAKKAGIEIPAGEWREEDSLMIQVKGLPLDARQTEWVLHPIRSEADIQFVARQAFDPDKWDRRSDPVEIIGREEKFKTQMRQFLSARNRLRERYSNVDAAVVIVPSPTFGDRRQGLISRATSEPIRTSRSGLSTLAEIMTKDFVRHYHHGKEERNEKAA